VTFEKIIADSLLLLISKANSVDISMFNLSQVIVLFPCIPEEFDEQNCNILLNATKEDKKNDPTAH